MIQQHKIAIAVTLIAASVIIGACSSSGPRTTSPSFSSGSSSQQIAELTNRINELTSQLEAARAEAESARNLAENAQATADAAQIMAASTDDRIEAMFEKSVFK